MISTTPFLTWYDTPSKKVIWVIGLVFVAFFLRFDRWDGAISGGDSWGYHTHLPAFLIHHDVGNYDKCFAATIKHWPNQIKQVLPTPTGKVSIKYPLGVAVMELPFFLIGHVGALLIPGFEPDGYSKPYAFMLGLGVIFYVLLGLWWLSHVFKRYFSPNVSALLLVCLALATNLFYFTSYNNIMSHALLFALYCGLLYAIHRFEDAPTVRNGALVGLATGMIALTRLHEAIAALIPLLWGVYSFQTLRQRFQFLFQHYRATFAAIAVGLLCLFPQALYYKFVARQWWWYAYQGEAFDFKNPHIWGGLTDYKNGWLIYTPIMIIALAGIFLLRRNTRNALGPIVTFLPIHIWITYSWWCWYYINGFGSRPMVETYPLLAFPLGAFFTWGSSLRLKSVLNYGLAAFFVYLNVFQTWQNYRSILWTEDCNKAYYWEVFGTLNPPESALIVKESNEKQPKVPVNYVKTLLESSFEDSTATNYTRAQKRSGLFSIRADNEFTNAPNSDMNTEEVQPGDWLRASVWGFMDDDGTPVGLGGLAMLVVTLSDERGEEIKHRAIRISTKIGNPDHSIWSTGQPGQWGQAAFYVKVPEGYKPGGRIKFYVWNPSKQPIFLDDLKLELYRG